MSILDNLIEPRSPIERELAIIWCRMNSWDRPLSNTPVNLEEHNLSISVWNAIDNIIDHKVALWMWNHGQDEWKRTPADVNDG